MADFTKGDRVVLTVKGRERGWQGRARTPYGTVISVYPKNRLIRVQRDGLKTPYTYFDGYWRKIEGEG